MFENKNSTETSFLASILFKSGAIKSANSRAAPQRQKGIHIGFEAKNKKDINSQLKNSFAETFEDEITSNKSTDVSERMTERASVTPVKSILGKRRPCVEEVYNEIDNYSVLNYIHEGVYGEVFRAKDKRTGEIFAVKKVKFFPQEQREEGLSISCRREINQLKTLSHSNIIGLNEVITSKNHNEIFLVMEYADHELRNLLQNSCHNLSVSEIKCLLKQLLEAVNYMHNKEIVHRDLKTSNLLYTNEGLLKICDFGLSREMKAGDCLTPGVVTLTYRAPEILVGCEKYTSAIDIWSVGCIFAELLLGEPLFKGKSQIEQIDLIFRTMGWSDKIAEISNTDVEDFYSIFAGLSFTGGVYLSDEGIDLLEQMLACDPAKRITAADALNHSWFQEEPRAKELNKMPRFSPTNEIGRERLTKKLFVNGEKFMNRE